MTFFLNTAVKTKEIGTRILQGNGDIRNALFWFPVFIFYMHHCALCKFP